MANHQQIIPELFADHPGGGNNPPPWQSQTTIDNSRPNFKNNVPVQVKFSQVHILNIKNIGGGLIQVMVQYATARTVSP